jgi:LuxR family maltose regulon positive regulatory protein
LAEPEGYVRLFVNEGAPMQMLLRDVRLDLARTGVDQQQLRILAYIDKLLAALNAQPPALIISTSLEHVPAYPLLEALTERELEVLRLVNDGLSNSEMAARLIVSVGTVKKHLNNIFGKLGVSSRTQALAVARTLRLL